MLRFNSVQQVLLCCSRTQLDGSARERLLGSIDGWGLEHWQRLLDLARYHGVTALVQQSLESCREFVPSPVLQELRRDRKKQGDLVFLRLHTLFSILELLEANGIEALPVKGPVLAAAAYGDVTLRPSIDLDLLLRDADLPKTWNLLASDGFESFPEDSEPRSPHWGSHHLPPLVHRRRVTTVELHRRLFPNGFCRPFSVWGDLRPFQLAGRTVPSLRPEVLLVYLTLHGARHGWQQLKWLCDVAELLRRQPHLDWDRVSALCHEMSCRRALEFGVALAVDWLEAPLPTDIAQSIPALDERLAAQVLPLAFPPRGRVQDLTLHLTRFHLAVQDSFSNRLAYFAGRAGLAPSASAPA